MNINRKSITKLLDNFQFQDLFIEELGWDYCDDETPINISVEEQIFTLTPIAHKRNLVVYQCLLENQSIPLSSIRKKLDREINKYAREHFIIYASISEQKQVWQWVKRETNQPLATRTVTYSHNKKEDLLQKLELVSISLEEEEQLSLIDIKSRVKKAFDVEKVTKQFYDKFKKQHSQFLAFIQGISDNLDQEWYASVMLNRLMFVYFIQKKGFLNNDIDYLRNKLNYYQQEEQKDKFFSFYRYFLLKLFHDGLGQQNRTPELDQLLGNIPYLNGGLFEIHPLENKYPNIEIKDEAFEQIFDFFDQYNWHLDDRPLKQDNEINPDVLGYIFEKYINQKQMGAYYTKEDITEYISKNCIIPYLFDSVKQELLGYISADEVEHSLGFHLLAENPNRYIYDAVLKGVDLDLPDQIAKGIDKVSERENWNQSADEDYALPTEIWREVVARRQRCLEIREKLSNGEITSINDLITYNLNIRQFAEDIITAFDSPLTLKIFYDTLSSMSILDPTCGSGAFLFAALNILEPLYDGCLERMQEFLEEKVPFSKEKNTEKVPLSKGNLGRSKSDNDPPLPPLTKGGVRENKGLTKGGVQKIIKEFQGILANVRSHTNRKYFILKNIMLNNLYGVDIMEEATEICKLRLFLKLASQVQPNPKAKNYGIEPLPDIDFNIRCGNSLVGFANYQEVEKSVKGDRQIKLDLFDDMVVINDKAKAVSDVYQTFRSIQTQTDGTNFKETKQRLQNSLDSLNDELNRYLAREYGIDINQKKDYQKWLLSHQPFHWFTEFYLIINSGGFDVIIGNPPYVEYRKLKYKILDDKYKVDFKSDIYSALLERSSSLIKRKGNLSMIVPISIFSTKGFISLQRFIINNFKNIWCSNFADSCKLFQGITKRLTIITVSNNKDKSFYETQYYKTHHDENLFQNLKYQKIDKLYYSVDGAVPKIFNKIEIAILNKIFSRKNKILAEFSKSNERKIYFTRTLRNFCLFHNEKPYRLDKNNTKVYASEIIEVEYDNDYYWEILAILNSNLFVYLSSI